MHTKSAVSFVSLAENMFYIHFWLTTTKCKCSVYLLIFCKTFLLLAIYFLLFSVRFVGYVTHIWKSFLNADRAPDYPHRKYYYYYTASCEHYDLENHKRFEIVLNESMCTIWCFLYRKRLEIINSLKKCFYFCNFKLFKSSLPFFYLTIQQTSIFNQ